MKKDIDLFSKLSPEEQKEMDWGLLCVDPLDDKYRKSITPLMPYISKAGEWNYCAQVQAAILLGLEKFKKATEKNVEEIDAVIEQIVPANITLLENDVTHHDQLAVIAELSRYVSEDTARKIHPGTTSYDILDTARNLAFKEAWFDVMRPEAVDNARELAMLARSEHLLDAVQVGRTHNQHTSPLYFKYVLSCYAVNIANAIERIDLATEDLEGKLAGITGSGASIAEFVGQDKQMDFEQHVIEDILELKLCTNPTQIIPKANLILFGVNILLLNGELANMANTMRLLYSAEIGEVVSMPEKERLGGSSADAGKNNPINWENIAGQYEVAKGGLSTLFALQVSDHQRDLRGSVQARYEPQRIMAMTYEALKRTRKAVKNLYVVKERMKANLEGIRKKPTEAMTGILKAHLFNHPEYGDAHESVKQWAKKAQKEKSLLLTVAMEDDSFVSYWTNKLDDRQREILSGNLEEYARSSIPRTHRNLKIVDRLD